MTPPSYDATDNYGKPVWVVVNTREACEEVKRHNRYAKESSHGSDATVLTGLIRA